MLTQILGALAVLGMVLLLIAGLCLALKRRVTHGLAVNIGERTRAGVLAKRSDAAHAYRHLLVTWGSDADHIKVAAASDFPLGICPDQPSGAEQPTAVNLLSLAKETQKAVVSEAIAITDELYSDDAGKVQNLPVAAGTYWKVGKPLHAQATANQVVEFIPCYPVKLVVT